MLILQEKNRKEKMNNNQDYNFDPMTGQPVQNNNNHKNNNNNKVIVTIIISIILVGICYLVCAKFMKEEDNIPPQNNDNTNIVNPSTDLTKDENGAFLMAIVDVFSLSSGTTIVTGTVERGTVKVGDTIQIIGLGHDIITTTVQTIELSRKAVEQAKVGDNIGVWLKDVSKDELERGQVLAKQNSIKSATKFDASVYVYSQKEGNKHAPFVSNDKAQFYFRTSDITGVITLPKDVEMANLGEDTTMTVALLTDVAMEAGTEFLIRVDGREVASGTVTKVY